MATQALNVLVENGNITVKQGTNASWAYVLKKDGVPVDITGWSCACQVRLTYDSSTALLTLTIDNAKVTNGGVDGTFTLYLAPTDTSVIAFKGELLECVYDVEITDGAGLKTRIAEGLFIIDREVTKV